MLGSCFSRKFSYVTNLFANVDPYIRVFFDRRTPWFSRVMLGLALGYLFSPIDLIPDVIPVVGQLDDVLVVAVLLYLARRKIPEHVRAEYWEPDGQ